MAGTVYTPAAGRTPDLPARLVAITFDDLPFATTTPETTTDRIARASDVQRRIVTGLERAHVPATGFVNEAASRALGRTGPRLLRRWNRGRLSLGNHGFDHADSNTLDLAAIERKVVDGEATIGPMAVAAGRRLAFYRFPYNHVGETEERRVAIEAMLARHGYRLAASTIDASDYLFDQAYERALSAKEPAMAGRIRDAYLAYTAVQIGYYGRLDRQVWSREVPAVMLLHADRLNADVITPLLRLFRAAGYRFVSLERAQADPAYAASPAYATRFGPMWGYRWAKERGVTVDGRLEQDPPAWISRYAAAATPASP